VEESYIRACPECLAARIAQFRYHSRLPQAPWLLNLEGEALREAEFQTRKDAAALTVSLDDLVRCARCAKVIRIKEARSFATPGSNSHSPNCRECFEDLSGQLLR